MTSQRVIESLVGVFVLCALFALSILAFKVSGLTSFLKPSGYHITATFDDIGSLKVRSSVKIGGVAVGEISKINLDPDSFKAIVTMRINANIKDIPDDSTATILTAGLLGDNYISITPMYSTHFLRNGDQIQETHSAMILEKLIGQLLFKVTGPSSSNTTNSNSQNTGEHNEKNN